MAEAKNIYAKLQQSRVDVLGEIKKGTQGFGYDYFSNDDILPVANEVLNRNGLCPVFKMENRKTEAKTKITNSLNTLEGGVEMEEREITYSYWGVLLLINSDVPSEMLVFETPTCLAAVKGASGIQNYGAMATFTKRYLYLQMLEIADQKNNGQGGIKDTDVEKSADDAKKEAKEPKEPKKVAKCTEKQVELIKSKCSEEDLKALLEFYKVKEVAELTVVQASDALKRLGG